jgi:hypothetical protein
LRHLKGFIQINPLKAKNIFFIQAEVLFFQLKAAMRTKPVYFFPVFIFSIIRIIWSFFPRKLRTSRLFRYVKMIAVAGWQSGYAAACKAVYAGSIPASASIYWDEID